MECSTIINTEQKKDVVPDRGLQLSNLKSRLQWVLNIYDIDLNSLIRHHPFELSELKLPKPYIEQVMEKHRPQWGWKYSHSEIHKTIWNGWPIMSGKVLDFSADPNKVDSLGVHPLHLAIYMDDAEAVLALVTRGLFPRYSLSGNRLNRVLTQAIIADKPKAARILCERGPVIRVGERWLLRVSKDELYEPAALQYAVIMERMDYVSLIIKDKDCEEMEDLAADLRSVSLPFLFEGLDYIRKYVKKPWRLAKCILKIFEDELR